MTLASRLTTLLAALAVAAVCAGLAGAQGPTGRAGTGRIPVNILLLLPDNDTYKFSSSKILPSLYLAIEDMRNVSRFEFDIIPDKCDCSSMKAPVNAMENIYRMRNHTKMFQAVFGPMCDYSLAPVARYAPFWNVSVMTVGALAQDFRKNKHTEYRTLTNIGPTLYWLDKFVSKVFKKFDWKQVIFLFDKDYQEQITNFNCYLTMASLKAALLNANVTVDYKIRDRQDKRSVETILEDFVGNKFSVVLLCGSTEFVGEIMSAAHKLGFINGEYVFINFDLYAQMHSENRLLRPWSLVSGASARSAGQNHSAATNDSVRLAYQGLMIVTAKVQDGKREYRAFQQRLVAHSPRVFRNETDVNFFVVSFYDVMRIYAEALEKTRQSGRDLNDVPAVLANIWSRKFAGITGSINIDSYGDRIGEFVMHDMNPETYEFEPVVSTAISDNDVLLEFTKRPIYWHKTETGVLPDSPKCGFNRAKCPVKKPLEFWVWLLIAMGILMVIMAIIGIIAYRRAQFEAELKAMNWLIRWEDVSATMAADDKKQATSKKRKSYSRDFADLEKNNEDAVSLASIDTKKMNAKLVVYKRSWCYLHKINRTRLEVSRALLLEVKKLKDLQNDHITRFIGICLEPATPYIFAEYCQKGSLLDLLEQQQIQLETSFKLHLMVDIVKGMLFIHSSEIKCHGNLRSSCCVVDSRFTVKITDFGLPMLRNYVYADPETHYRKQLWKAPELQSDFPGVNSFNGTPKGDVYSFGIIAQEILYRKGVFYLNDEDVHRVLIADTDQNYDETNEKDFLVKTSLSHKEICVRARDGLRPSLNDEICQKEICDLLKKCWHANPAERPDFTYIRDFMRKKTNVSGNILDNLLNRMEKYANNLEDLVKERTEACENERKRAETLLYRLLPTTVASQLMRGSSVAAESFDSVTIYFSDICGFTKLSASSTPLQVVRLLNGLYTLFDSIIEAFDVYKVETIGDAYMVVSGLPQRNEDHAGQIARMSLALLHGVKSFQIPHLPESKLELRIGLHTGPAVAGVVGLKMPRYCLFGDTVNTASRMESNGAPLRIHISPQTKEALDKFGTFDIQLRGPVEMKGKGVITTYWLLGENGQLVDQRVD